MQNNAVRCTYSQVPTLKEILCAPERRPQVVQDAARLVDQEVDSKGGLSGAGIKIAYKTVTKIKPGLITEVVDGLLDKFVDKLEPFYTEWQNGGKQGSFESFITDGSRKNKVANALLGVTDDRARTVHNATLKKAYGGLRPQGEKHVEAAIPGLARMMTKYLSQAGV